MPELHVKTYNEQLREIAALYRESSQPWPATVSVGEVIDVNSAIPDQVG